MGHSIDSSRPIMAPSPLSQTDPQIYNTILTNLRIQVSSKRTSKRYSTYSSLISSEPLPSGLTANTTTHGDPASTNSSSYSTANSSDPRIQEIKEWSTGFERLENKYLQKQRYQPTPEKSDNLSKLALSAKVERALGRRMTDQDASFRPSAKGGVVREKPARSVTTAS
ncbi:MAG: hypothetical protein LQ338_003052 [Usnochroma carphineum]|nr:MAG: hypothetical protein LQ338_003052 [Usnochroma carphineum]